MSDQTISDLPGEVSSSAPAPDEPRSTDGASVPATILATVSGLAAGWATVQMLRRRRSAPTGRMPDAQSEAPAVQTDSAYTAAIGAADPFRRETPVSEMKPEPQARAATAASQTASHTSASPPLHSVYPGNTSWSRPTKYLVGIGLIVFGVLLLYWSRSFLSIIVTAVLISFIIRPLIDWVHHKLRFPRGLATAVSYLIAALVIMMIPLIVIPTLWEGIRELQAVDYDPIYETILGLIDRASLMLRELPVVGDLASGALQPLEDLIRSLQQSAAPEWLVPESALDSLNLSMASVGAVTGIVAPVVVWFLAAAVTLVISVYLTSGRYSVRRFVLYRLPPAYVPEVATLFDRITWTWTSYLQGQLKLMLFIGVVVFLGNLVLGNRYAIVLGLISGLLELIPSLGPALALIPGVFLALVFGSSWLAINHLVFAIIILVFYLVVQIVENQVVVPRVLGDAVELPPLVVLVGVLVGGSLAGILGALIAVPVIGTAKEIVSYLYGKIVEAPTIEGPPPSEAGIVSNLRATSRRLATRFFRQTEADG